MAPRIVFAALAAGALGFGGCGGEGEGETRESERTYVESPPFSVRIPAGWEHQPASKEGLVLHVVAPFEGEDDPFQEEVLFIVEKVPPGMTLEGYRAAALSVLRRQTVEYEEDARGKMTVDDQPISWVNCWHRVLGEDRMALLYFMVKNRTALSIVCHAEPVMYDEYRPVFDEIVESFRFE